MGMSPPASDALPHPARDGEHARAGSPGRSRARRSADLLLRHPLLVVMATLGAVVRVVFWQVTDRRFEDGLITIKHAVNAADGVGLTHHVGEPLTHGFTSALSVLIPLGGELVREAGGFPAMRVASVVAFVVAAVFAYRLCQDLGVGTIGTLFALSFLAFDRNQVFYGMSGMEGQVVVAILLAGAWCVGRGHILWSGVLLGVAVLGRPDLVLWAGAALLYLLWRHGPARAGRAAAAAALVVAPWLVFTTIYYGSPVPNTIPAKSLRYPTNLPEGLWTQFDERSIIWSYFAPFPQGTPVIATFFSENVRAWVAGAFIVLILIGAWALRRRHAFWPALAFAGLFVVYKMAALPPGYYEWYMVPPMAVLAIVAGAGISHLGRVAPRTAALVGGALTVAIAVHLPFTIPLERRYQQIEDQVRWPMARYLDREVAPGERVVSESAGYVGYYSDVTLYDYPGLTSPGAFATLERLGSARNSMEELINAARPEWIVQRPGELELLRRQFPDAAAAYAEQARFGPPQIDLTVGGVSGVSLDTEFVVLRRVR